MSRHRFEVARIDARTAGCHEPCTVYVELDAEGAVLVVEPDFYDARPVEVRLDQAKADRLAHALRLASRAAR